MQKRSLVSICAIFLVIAGVIVADPSSVRAADPVVSGLIVATSTSGSDISAATLTEGTTTSLFAIGTGSDADGCAQIDNSGFWTASLYRSTVLDGPSCASDDASCYRLSSGDVSLGAVPVSSPNTCDAVPDTDLGFSIEAAVQFFADPTDAGAATYAATDWSFFVEVLDGMNTGNATDTVEINTLLALDPSPASINYGSIALNSQSAQQTLTISTTGNAALDVEVAVDGDMACSVNGSVPASMVRYSTTDGFAYASGVATSVTPATVQMDLAKPTSLTPVTDDLYLRMGLPEFGVAGSCANTLVLTALADSS